MTIALYDTTLRDGSQREDIHFSCDDKLTIAKRLDQLGIHYIEGGWPGSNTTDQEFFRRARQQHWRHSQISAFSSTRHKDQPCEQDIHMQALLAAETQVVTLFGKSWHHHLPLIGATESQNLAMISDSIAYMKAHGKTVFFDAEHFFDGFKHSPEFALACLQTAAKAGADALILCETNGGCLPWDIATIFDSIYDRWPEAKQQVLGIHAHNDAGCGVANSLTAVRHGCRQVQGTINGYGERVGNANLTTIIPDLQLKMGHQVVSTEQLQSLTATATLVAEIANLPLPSQQPFAGKSAFAHKGGIHVSAIRKDADSYQHIDPAHVGNRLRVLVSDLAGRSNLHFQAQAAGYQLDTAVAQSVLAQIKQRESQGFSYEAAEASVELMIRRQQPEYQAPFKLIDYMAVVEQRNGRGLLTEATVKLTIDGQLYHTAGEGNGPVNALAIALRKALTPRYPQLATIHLSDYKVRILDSRRGTGAITRVLIQFHDQQRSWTTVGASHNIIDASWQALSDSMAYALLNQTPIDTPQPNLQQDKVSS